MNKHFKDLTDIRMKYSLPYSLNNYRETDYLLTDYDNLTIRLLKENEKLLKYKNAWEELTETLTHYFELEFADTSVQSYMKELEHKHDIIKMYETYIQPDDEEAVTNAFKELDFIKVDYKELVQMHPIIAESTALYIRFKSDIELGTRFSQMIEGHSEIDYFTFKKVEYED